jgi:hypothetical protein
VRRQRFLENSNTSLIMRRMSKDSVLVDSLLVLPTFGFKHREAPHRRAQSCIICS